VGTIERTSVNVLRPNTTGAPIRHGTGSLAASAASASSTPGSMRAAAVSVTCGRFVGDRWWARLGSPAAASASQS
jgi:hypothetical protein